MCRNIGKKCLPWTYMYTTIKVSGKHVIQTNPSKFAEVILRHIFVQITFETRKRNTRFYVLRQGVPQ